MSATRPNSDAQQADLASLAERLTSGDRGALARAITLAESTRDADRVRATRLLDMVWSIRPPDTLRFAVTGPPGAGKSTFIERLGALLLPQGRRIAVLAVDPTSRRSGGSILGDKTRMPELASHADVFIRPSPSAGNLGGVTRSTRDVIVLCEAAGYDTTIVETVGVGQSEIEVEGIVDFVLLVLLAGAGDELQGIKRGILEVADILVVNKLDVDREAVLAARRLYRTAASILEPRLPDWKPPVIACSSVTGEGIDQIAGSLIQLDTAMAQSETKESHRAEQRRAWFKTAFRDLIISDVLSDPTGLRRLEALGEEAATGTRSPATLARNLVAELAARTTPA